MATEKIMDELEYQVFFVWDGVPSEKPLGAGSKEACLDWMRKNWKRYNKGKGELGLARNGRLVSFMLEEITAMQDNPKDIITVDVPLLIRLLEYAREDAKTDMDLHNLTDRMIALCNKGITLTMQNYGELINQVDEGAKHKGTYQKIGEPSCKRPFRAKGMYVYDADGRAVVEGSAMIPARMISFALNKTFPANVVDEGRHKNTIAAMNQMRYIPKIGDKIHAGVGTAGGAGFSGTVTKLDDVFVYFKSDEGRTFRAPYQVVTRG
jgi:hypothetical protein